MCKKYTTAQIKKAAGDMLAYFAESKAYKEFERLDQSGSVIGYKRYPNPLPTLHRFAAEHLGVSSRTLHRWATDADTGGKLLNPHFADVYDICKDYKHDQLLNCALMGLYTSEITKMELKNHHGYTDKTEVDNNISDLGNILTLRSRSDAKKD